MSLLTPFLHGDYFLILLIQSTFMNFRAYKTPCLATTSFIVDQTVSNFRTVYLSLNVYFYQYSRKIEKKLRVLVISRLVKLLVKSHKS